MTEVNNEQANIPISVRPNVSHDFYSSINWDWLQSNPIPNEYTKWGNFHVLHEKNQESSI
jgi:predicted metalloendopeptidase